MSNTAFHSRLELKREILSRVLKHLEADQVVYGPGFWDGTRGSIVGVTAHTNDPAILEQQTGIPADLLSTVERLWRLAFNRMGFRMKPWKESGDANRLRAFPLRWLEAIPVGSDVRDVPGQMLVRCLRRARELDDAALVKPNVHELLRRAEALHLAATDTTDPVTWRSLREQSSTVAKQYPDKTMDWALANLAATAAWPNKASGGLAADVIEAWVELAQALARRDLHWSADDETLRVRLAQEREELLMENMGKQFDIRPYDESIKRDYPEALRRNQMLRDEVNRQACVLVEELEAALMDCLASAQTQQ